MVNVNRSEGAYNPRISILMPVYNGSKYLRKTLDSIREQTFADYELICIDDCSTDGSLKILEEYRAIDPRFRLISTPTNQRIVPKVINYAIPHVRGDYFVYTSQDDLFSRDWLEAMYEKAVSTGADAVIPDVVLYYENEPEKNTTISVPGGDKRRILTNREAVMLSLDWLVPGNALWVVRFLKEIGYYDFGLNADEYTARVYFFNCNKVVFSGGTFYYRQDNPEAITKKLSELTFDYPYTDFKLFEFLREHGFPLEVQETRLLDSVETLIALRHFLTTYTVKRLMGRQADGSVDIKLAAGRIRSCFDALSRHGFINHAPDLRKLRGRVARIMLVNYGMFCVLSSLSIWARRAMTRAKAAVE